MPSNDCQRFEKSKSSAFAVVRTFAMPWARGDTYMAADHFFRESGFYTAHYRECVLVDQFSELMDAASAEQADEQSILDGMVGLAAGYRRWVTCPGN